MNKRKYKGVFYPARHISDLRDLVKSSAALYREKPVYLVKDVPGGPYRPITYNQFSDDVDALGTALIDMGLKDEKIAILGENSYEWVLVYCAVTNGTGVVVPIDKELSSHEIKNLLARSGTSTAFHSAKTEGLLRESAEGVETLKRIIAKTELPGLLAKGRELLAGGDRRFLDAEIDKDALCSLLFTSGTTGHAKGVMLSHENIANNVINISRHVTFTNGIGLSVLPMHHTYEMTCHILLAMYMGVGVAMCEGLKHVAKNMIEAKVSVLVGVPLLFESMHKKMWKKAEASGKADKLRKAIALSQKFKLYNYPKIVKRIFKDIHAATGGNIQAFITGGAAIDPNVVRDFEAMGLPTIQGYGMTENSPLISGNTDRFSKADSVGVVMYGNEVKIDDPDEKGMGEILCRGPSVMLGYFNDPEETAKVIRDGWLHTGDYGYFDSDDVLYISGRKKNVIVTKNGKNIFPEEVEYYLTQSDYILEALVIGIDDEKSGDIVVKAVVHPDFETIAQEKGDLPVRELRELLKTEIDAANELMPLYKRVKRFDIRKTEFHKTTTRKIKRYTPENYGEQLLEEENPC